jgi:hypothetical protein
MAEIRVKDVDPEFYKALKVEAVRRGVSVGEYILRLIIQGKKFDDQTGNTFSNRMQSANKRLGDAVEGDF